MYGISLIPLIMTYYQFDNGKILGAIIHLIAALVVIAVTYRLNRTKRSFLAHLLLAFNVPVMGYAFYLLAEKGIPTTMDAVATAVVLLTILYTTLSLNFVTAKLQRNIEQPEQER
jgi:Ca2+/Na+ antiporter